METKAIYSTNHMRKGGKNTEIKVQVSGKKAKSTVVPIYNMKTYRRSGGTAPLIPNLVIDAGEWLTSRPCTQ